MTDAAIFRLKVTLDDVEPQVLRRIEVPADIKLDRLHLTLQAALGWTNSHLYEIRARDTGWGLPDPNWPDGPLDARKAKLIDVLEDVGVKTLRYLYDFGDGWEHTIKIERMIAPEPDVVYPRLVEAAGRCPPEDVGGPWGTPRYSKLSMIRSTSATSKSASGSATTSTQSPSTQTHSKPMSPRSQSDGPGSLPSRSYALHNPRSSSEAYTRATAAIRRTTHDASSSPVRSAGYLAQSNASSDAALPSSP